MKRAVLSRGQPRTKVDARHRSKLLPAARTLGTARSPAYAHGQFHYAWHALVGESVPLLREDRRRHVYIIGQTGTGKAGLLTKLMRADLDGAAGFCLLYPHGDASKEIAAPTPPERMQDVIYLDPSDPTYTFAYNPLSGVAENEHATATANIVSAFKNIWSQSRGPRLEYILTNALRLLLDAKDQSLLGLPRLLIDDTYREWLLRRCNYPMIRSFGERNMPPTTIDSARRRLRRSKTRSASCLSAIDPLSKHFDARHFADPESGQSAHRQSLQGKPRHGAFSSSRRASHYRFLAGRPSTAAHVRRSAARLNGLRRRIPEFRH